MSEQIGRVRCDFCMATGETCRRRQVVSGGAPCCALCRCIHIAQADGWLPPPSPPAWENLGVGGQPIHPAKCSATPFGIKGVACAYCYAIERWKAVQRARQLGSLQTMGEAV